MRNDVLNLAQFYDTRLAKYLHDNRTTFPLYKTDSDNNLNPSKNTYFSGVYLGRKNNNCSDYSDYETDGNDEN